MAMTIENIMATQHDVAQRGDVKETTVSKVNEAMNRWAKNSAKYGITVCTDRFTRDRERASEKAFAEKFTATYPGKTGRKTGFVVMSRSPRAELKSENGQLVFQ